VWSSAAAAESIVFRFFIKVDRYLAIKLAILAAKTLNSTLVQSPVRVSFCGGAAMAVVKMIGGVAKFYRSIYIFHVFVRICRVPSSSLVDKNDETKDNLKNAVIARLEQSQ
jgi:hypothetical protein